MYSQYSTSMKRKCSTAHATKDLIDTIIANSHVHDLLPSRWDSMTDQMLCTKSTGFRSKRLYSKREPQHVRKRSKLSKSSKHEYSFHSWKELEGRDCSTHRRQARYCRIGEPRTDSDPSTDHHRRSSFLCKKELRNFRPKMIDSAKLWTFGRITSPLTRSATLMRSPKALLVSRNGYRSKGGCKYSILIQLSVLTL